MPPIKRHTSLFALALSLLVSCCLVLVTGCRDEAGAAASISNPATPEKQVPWFSTVSTTRTLEMTFRWEDGAPQTHETHLIFPKPAGLQPEITRLRLRRVADGNTSGTQVIDLAEARRRDAKAVNTLAGRCVRAQEKGWVRFWRLVHVAGSQREVALGTQKWSIESISVRFPFSGTFPTAPSLPEYNVRDRGYGQILDKLVANPDAMSIYAARDGMPRHSEPACPDNWSPLRIAPNGSWFRVDVTEDAMYRISLEHIEAAGFDASWIDPGRVRVFTDGHEIPTLLRGPATRRFGTQTHLVFFGEANDSPYTRARAYWVWCDSPDDAVRLRMAVRDSSRVTDTDAQAALSVPHALRLEEDNDLQLRRDDFLSIQDLRWVWTGMDAEEPFEARFDLPYLDSRRTEPARVELSFYAPSVRSSSRAVLTSLPSLEVRINDAPKRVLPRFKDAEDLTATYEIPVRFLNEEDNVIVVRYKSSAVKRDYPDLYLDDFVVHYDRGLVASDGRLEMRTDARAKWFQTGGFGRDLPLLFDLSDPSRPTRVLPVTVGPGVVAFREDRANRRYIAVTEDALTAAPEAQPLLRPEAGMALPGAVENAADYLIIYHPMFRDAIQPLVDLHQARGRTVRTVDVNLLYQEYSHGELSPVAIKDFLYDAVTRWHAPPSYVLLFGDASSDYRDELKTGVENLVPAYTHGASTEDRWASELWYTTLLGGDLLPDVILGRMSVRNQEDARAVVEKTVRYATNPPLGPWRGRLGYFADDTEPGFDFRDTTMELFENYQPDAYQNTRLFLEEFPWEDNFYIPREIARQEDKKVSTAATLGLLQTFNRGVAMMVFVGHGSPNLWATERVWFGGDSERSDNRNLKNGGRQPFVVSFTCNQGAFDYPQPYLDINISEDMMRQPNAGSIAMYVPSGPGIPSIHAQMARDLFTALWRDGVHGIGEAVTLGRIYSLQNSSSDDMVRMSVLLGDPALELVRPGHEIRGDISPGVVAAAETAGVEPVGEGLVFEAATPGVVSGKVSLVLYGPDERLVMREGPLRFRRGRVRWEFDLPRNAATGQWTVRGYYGDPETGQDGMVWGTVQVTIGMVRVTDLEAVNLPTDVPGEVLVRFKVTNESTLDLKDVPLVGGLADGQGNWVTRDFEEKWDLEPGETRQTEFQCNLKQLPATIQVGALRHTVPVHDTKGAEPPARISVSRPDPAQKLAVHQAAPPRLSPADLRVVPDTLHCEPGYPEEGHTAYVHAVIENAGGTETGPFTMGASAIRPDKHTPIQSQPQLPHFDQKTLGAGRKRPIRIRWDMQAYQDHSGWTTISLKLDTRRRVRESDEENNEATAAVRVLSRPDVRIEEGSTETALLPEEDTGALRATVAATVKNHGESVAYHRRAGFYNRPPQNEMEYLDSDILAHEMALEPIAGGTTRTVTWSWVIEDADHMTSPTVRVYENLETVRAEAASMEAQPVEW